MVNSAFKVAICITISLTVFGQYLIEPTSIDHDGNAEYYVNSESSNGTYFVGGTINCNADSCNISCDEISGCEGSTINALNTTALNIECNKTDSCRLMTINSYSNIITINLECSVEFACDGLILNAQNAKEVNINCINTLVRTDENDPSCVDMNISAQYADIVNINAYPHDADAASKYFLDNAGTINIDFRGFWTAQGLEIYANNAQSVTIHCAGWGACDGEQWYLSKATLNCYGLGCYSQRITTKAASISGIDLNVYSCDECSDVASCFGHFHRLAKNYAKCDSGQIDCYDDLINQATFYATGDVEYCDKPSEQQQQRLGCASDEVELYYENGNDWQDDHEWAIDDGGAPSDVYAEFSTPYDWYDLYDDYCAFGFCFAISGIYPATPSMLSPVISTMNYKDIRLKYTVRASYVGSEKFFCSALYSVDNGTTFSLIDSDSSYTHTPVFISKALPANSYNRNNVRIRLQYVSEGYNMPQQHHCYFDEIRICGRGFPTRQPTLNPTENPSKMASDTEGSDNTSNASYSTRLFISICMAVMFGSSLF